MKLKFKSPPVDGIKLNKAKARETGPRGVVRRAFTLAKNFIDRRAEYQCNSKYTAVFGVFIVII